MSSAKFWVLWFWEQNEGMAGLKKPEEITTSWMNFYWWTSSKMWVCWLKLGPPRPCTGGPFGIKGASFPFSHQKDKALKSEPGVPEIRTSKGPAFFIYWSCHGYMVWIIVHFILESCSILYCVVSSCFTMLHLSMETSWVWFLAYIMCSSFFKCILGIIYFICTILPHVDRCTILPHVYLWPHISYVHVVYNI